MKFKVQSSKFKVPTPEASLRAKTLVCLLGLGLTLLLSGCATAKVPAYSRPFIFLQDSFTYANELVWEYHFDPTTGKATHNRREPPPVYTHHCFVVARSARQFFQHARFDPAQAVADEATYRKLIRRVIAINPRKELAESEKIIIPGYTNLYAFSQAQAVVLQAECGGAWQSYLQRGHWRMMLPLSRHHQENMARQLMDSLRKNRPPVVHLVRFPKLSINHAVLLFDVKETEQEIQFATYDPNDSAKPFWLTYNRTERTFSFPGNFYFIGGRVDVYEIYREWNY